MITTLTDRTPLLPRLADQTGGDVICLATGPSLTAEDVTACRSRGTVVVVNDAHRLAPWADVLYSGDRYWWAHHRGVPTFQGRKVTIEYAAGRRATDLRRVAPDMVFMRQTGHDGIELAPDGLRTCGLNSGGQAVNVAVHLGARRIILLGYDMGATQGKRHFFGDHPSPLSNMQNFPRWRLGFDRMAPDLAALGIEVLNCSRTTSIAAFPRGRLEEVWR